MFTSTSTPLNIFLCKIIKHCDVMACNIVATCTIAHYSINKKLNPILHISRSGSVGNATEL